MSVKTMNDLWAEYEPARVVGLKTAPELARIYSAYVAPVFGARRIDKINFKMLEFWHKELKQAPVQANRALTLLRSMFKYAQAIELLPYGHNPARYVRLYPERKRRRFMTIAEAPVLANELILREEGQPVFACIIWAMIFTGARSGELLKATWGDLRDGTITLAKHKTDNKGENRIIVLPPFVLAKMDALLKSDRHPKARIFPITKSNLTQWWIRTRKAAGFPDLRIHDLRHTFATYALDQGYSLAQIGEALGHASAQTTKIYVDLSNQMRRKVAAHSSLAILHDMKVIEVDDPNKMHKTLHALR